jgi:acetolactate synthase I/II/III large subunit
MTTRRSGAAHLGLPYYNQYDAVNASDIWADPKTQSYPAYPAAGGSQRTCAVLEGLS